MARQKPVPPCRAIAAPVHGTLHAYRKWKCRCPAATEANRLRKERWNATPAGQAYAARVAARKREEYAAARGLAEYNRRRAEEARERAHDYLMTMPNATARQVAERAGVCTRTVQRWLARQRTELAGVGA